MPVNILHLIKSLGRGGAEVLLAEGLAVADRERFSYEYGFFLPWKDVVVPAIEAHGARVTCYDASGNLAMLLRAGRIAREVRERNISLIHAHLPMAGVVARLVGRMTGVPVVYTEHNLQERYHRLTRWLNTATWGLQAEGLAVSADVEASIRRHMDERTPVRTVLNGVNVGTYARGVLEGRDIRKELGIADDAPVVGTVAVFRTQKRLQDWMAVARQVVDALPEARFIVVGEGPERPAVETAITEHGLGNHVYLVGLQEETRPYFEAMDIYLMTSQFEGLPIALLEAMAMEVAPVVTSVGGIPELVRHDVNGRMKACGDIEGMARDVIEILRKPALRGELASAARQTVVDGFSMERMQRELENIYIEVLDRWPRKTN
jgi:L-malate glycosyltransferase